MTFQSLYGPGILAADDMKRLASALSAGLTCSEHSLTGGGKRHYFIDLPRVLTHPDSASLIVERSKWPSSLPSRNLPSYEGTGSYDPAGEAVVQFPSRR